MRLFQKMILLLENVSLNESVNLRDNFTNESENY